MRLTHVLLGLTVVVLAALSNAMPAGAQQRSPVYVGARVCARCHSGPEAGHQFSLWLRAKHSIAYATLAKPEAKKIAELSGIRVDPQDSFTCLGCHSSGAQAEDWEKDDTFRVEDGVQCETCHGPGSEYMAEGVMADRQAAMEAGLRAPDRDTCLRCHKPKGTHVAVLRSPQLDVVEAMARIAHPLSGGSILESTTDASGGAGEKRPGPKYLGSAACGSCHSGSDSGYQHSVWRMSAHAGAWATLATPSARDLARERGVEGDPQKSPDCLSCHSTGASEGPEAQMASFSPDEGVGCEACHGAGSEYALEAIMRDPSAAKSAGLRDAGPETCLPCHQDAHGKPFAAGLQEIAHPTRLPEPDAAARYKTPLNLALRPDGREIYVTCSASDSVIVVDPERRVVVAEIPVGRQPEDVAFSPDGSRAFVTNMFDDTVSVIDVATREEIRVLPVGDEPHGVLTDSDGKRLYVLNAASDDISVYDAVALEWIKNLSASRRPWSLSRSPDGGSLVVTHALSRFVPFRTTSETEATLIDTENAVVEDRSVLEGANLLMGVDWHPSGDFALVTLNRTKNLVPMTRLLQGWTITNGLGILWRNGAVDQVLLDEPDMSFPDPTDVAITPDGRYALVTSSGTDRVAVVDLDKLTALIRRSSDYERQHVLPNHLGKPTEFVVAQIPTRDSPRGVLVMPNGKTAFVANALDDSLTVIDLARLEAVGRIDLGGPETITQVRIGERLFHSADISFHRQFSCHTCHPDGHVDGLTYDIEPDGIGMSPVDNRTLRGILDTAPFKWEGTNPSLQRQCGPRLAVFFTRVEPFTPDELVALEHYIATIPRPPNRHRPLGADLTPAQRNGKRMFERTVTNDGRPIPPEGRCITCHFPPYYSDRSIRDVGTRMSLDQETQFDVPHLNNIYDSAPYLHNGIAHTLEEIWTVYNPHDEHGVTNDMTKDQLNDLIEYVKTL
jgi:YVTN family beta-propeller protein